MQYMALIYNVPGSGPQPGTPEFGAFMQGYMDATETYKKEGVFVAGDALHEQFPEQFFYFPSYEIVMDELRDYRFYAEDMLHTSDQATRYIWEKFQRVLIEAGSREISGEVEALRKMLEHRPLNEEGDAAQLRQTRMQEKLEVAKKKHPDLDWEKLH